MGKNVIVRTLQTAYLDVWIGDYENAEKLLAEIEATNSDISYLFRKTVKERMKKIDTDKRSESIEACVYLLDKFNGQKQLLLLPEYLQSNYIPEELINDYTPVTCWKYSATIISQVDSDYRIDLRGYNPNGRQPNLAFDWNADVIQIRNWKIEKSSLKEGQTSLVSFNATSEHPAICLYFSVDIWGLLSGVAIVNNKDIGIALTYIDYLFGKISSQLWPSNE